MKCFSLKKSIKEKRKTKEKKINVRDYKVNSKTSNRKTVVTE